MFCPSFLSVDYVLLTVFLCHTIVSQRANGVWNFLSSSEMSKCFCLKSSQFPLVSCGRNSSNTGWSVFLARLIDLFLLPKIICWLHRVDWINSQSAQNCCNLLLEIVKAKSQKIAFITGRDFTRQEAHRLKRIREFGLNLVFFEKSCGWGTWLILFRVMCYSKLGYILS